MTTRLKAGRHGVGVRRPLALLVVALLGVAALTPVSAHVSERPGHNWRKHYKKLAKRTFYTKRQSNDRFVNAGETAADADLLDGLDSTEFAAAAHAHDAGDITSGVIAFGRLPVGTGSTEVAAGDHTHALAAKDRRRTAAWVKDAADVLPADAVSERVVLTAPDALTVTDVFIEPAGALIAGDVDFATITVRRRDADGSNPVVVASATTQTAGSGGTGDWTAFGVVSLGPLSNASVSDGQKLTVEVTKAGLGVVVPVLTLQVEYTVD